MGFFSSQADSSPQLVEGGLRLGQPFQYFPSGRGFPGDNLLWALEFNLHRISLFPKLWLSHSSGVMGGGLCLKHFSPPALGSVFSRPEISLHHSGSRRKAQPSLSSPEHKSKHIHVPCVSCTMCLHVPTAHAGQVCT